MANAKGRDLFDLCAVAAGEPEQLRVARPFLARHGAAFLQALAEREDVVRREFAEIDVIGRIERGNLRNPPVFGWRGIHQSS